MGEPRDDGAAEAKQERRRIKELERDLSRKDKALAETAALLVLSKTYGPPRLQVFSAICLSSLRQRIRPLGCALTKMEIRAPRAS